MKMPIAAGFALLLFTALTLNLDGAQPRPKSPDRLSNRDQEQTGFRGRPFARILTDEQREQVRTLMQEHRGEMRNLEERIQRLQREVADSVFGERLNEEALRHKMRELAIAESERTLFRARVIARIRPTLTEDQIEKLRGVWDAAPRARRLERMAEQPRRQPGAQREGSDLPPPRPPAAPNGP